MIYRVATSLLLLLSLLPALGCDKASPVAPNGTILSVSASPARIPLNGRSTITIIGRKPDGNPLNDGTEVRLTASLGSIDPFVTVDRNGTATATFQSDGRLGTATITAATGGAVGGTSGSGGSGGTTGTGSSSSGTLTATVSVQVGEAAKSITLQPTPTTIPADLGPVTLLAIVRDSLGQPLPNQGVNFTTEIGTLSSRGSIVQTNARGEARDTLRVTEADLANNPTSITVTAQTAGGDGALVTATAEIRVVSDRPVASFAFDRGATDLQVAFTDTSTGPDDLDYTWDFGDNTSSNMQNPVHTYATGGQYTVRLTVTAPSGQSDTATARVTVPVTTPGTGQ